MKPKYVMTTVMLVLLFSSLIVVGAKDQRFAKTEEKNIYKLEASDVVFSEDYTYFDFYMDNIPEEDRSAIIEDQSAIGVLSPTYDEKGKAIYYGELSSEEKMGKIEMAEDQLEKKYSSSELSGFEAEYAALIEEHERLYLQKLRIELLIENEKDVEALDEHKSNLEDINGEISVTLNSVEVLLEKYDMKED